LNLEADLRHALELNQFSLHYQPKIDVATDQLSGVEALLRWTHPKLGNLSPAEFIPLAEETGSIIPIGRWVLNSACAQNMSWQAAGLPAISVAVNLSPRQFIDPQLLDRLDEALAKSGMPPDLLQLEITESTVMHNVDRAAKLLGEIKRRGVRLAIDDFGTGYSSLAYLMRFPVDILKIDQSFIASIGDSAEALAMVHALVQLGHALGLKTLAEGIEDADQLEHLRAEGCDSGQGYFLGTSMDPATIDAMLAAGASTVAAGASTVAARPEPRSARAHAKGVQGR
jgi:EAL domain-containing protein (putative c-di-GMP-specific phosphodiesterase class I)